MKKALIIVLIFIGLIVFFLYKEYKSGVKIRNFNRIGWDESFKTGDTIYPDFVVDDTLIVTNGDSLTKDYKLIMATTPDYPSDREVRGMFYKWGRKIK